MIDKEKFTKNMAYLGIAYGKEYTVAEIELHYDFLKEFNNDTMVAAIKSLIKKSKFLPKVSDLVEECEKCSDNIQFRVLDFMNERGYFKAAIEYEKSINFVKRNVIPEWLLADMREYYQLMIKETKQIEQSRERLALE